MGSAASLDDYRRRYGVFCHLGPVARSVAENADPAERFLCLADHDRVAARGEA